MLDDATAPGAAGKQSVLVVEDESIAATTVAMMLRDLGYLVAGTARSAAEALALDAQHEPDLILMDVLLEGEPDGIEAAREMRSRRDVTIVFMTGCADEATLARAEAVEPEGYLSKPLRKSDLRSTLRLALRRSGRNAVKARPPAAGSGLYRAVLRSRRYEMMERIAAGGMGAVYRARHSLLDRDVAAKILTAPTQEARAMFVEEGRALARLRHPNVVEVYDLDDTGDAPFMIMELLKGRTLEDHLDEMFSLGVPEATSIARQVLAGLGAAHERNIIHRDVKPSNVFLVDGADGTPITKVIDFGICAIAGEGHGPAGTPGYLAPEQIEGDVATAATDLWAVGVTMYEMLTGRAPFKGDMLIDIARSILHDDPVPVRELAQVPPGLDAVISRLLSKSLADRYQRVADVLDDLGATSTRSTPSWGLVVDPDPARGRRSRSVIEAFGLRAHVARTGLEAANRVRDEGTPRVAIIDISHAREDGFRLLRALRKLAPRMISIVTSVVPGFLEAARGAPDLDVRAAVPSDDTNALRAAVATALGEDVPSSSDSPKPNHASLRPLPDAAPLVLRRPPAEQALAELVDEVARTFHVPVVLACARVSGQLWHKLHVGAAFPHPGREHLRPDEPFWHYAVDAGDAVVIEDARSHPLLASHPLVTSGALGSYVGVPIPMAGGGPIGALCVIDPAPRSFGSRDVEDLGVLARQVGGELALAGQGDDEDDTLDRGGPVAGGAARTHAEIEVDEDHRVVSATSAFLAQFRLTQDVVGSARGDLFARLASSFEQPEEFLAKTRVARGGPFMASGVFRLASGAGGVRWLAKPQTSVLTRYRMREWFLAFS